MPSRTEATAVLPLTVSDGGAVYSPARVSACAQSLRSMISAEPAQSMYGGSVVVTSVTSRPNATAVSPPRISERVEGVHANAIRRDGVLKHAAFALLPTVMPFAG